ncbi:hypothetical protein Q4F19_10715 [Sphingomonas sp. BIUV-7]|uniref:Uncharacterized protein n=1 Tax=Sphingomonas natans TaxID=3063330 RepID=A0ABT8YA34_9SPHN|nr:hypothetical protein [Sphingomonas sp. BIUV-7]MDO6414852.1 hypothetical protein [Sphingomonas sp. BIUV-7]
MAIWALAFAALTGVSAPPRNVPATFDLADVATPTMEKRKIALPLRKRRSRYLLPKAELPAEDAPGIELRWKLRKVKLTMPLPTIG